MYVLWTWHEPWLCNLDSGTRDVGTYVEWDDCSCEDLQHWRWAILVPWGIRYSSLQPYMPSFGSHGERLDVRSGTAYSAACSKDTVLRFRMDLVSHACQNNNDLFMFFTQVDVQMLIQKAYQNWNQLEEIDGALLIRTTEAQPSRRTTSFLSARTRLIIARFVSIYARNWGQDLFILQAVVLWSQTSFMELKLLQALCRWRWVCDDTDEQSTKTAHSAGGTRRRVMKEK